MSDHLPECFYYMDDFGNGERCICDRLRACEERVLEAAREAVEEIRDAIQTHYRIDCEPPGKVDWSQHRKCDPINDALAAIDALREEKPPPLSPSVGVPSKPMWPLREEQK